MKTLLNTIVKAATRIVGKPVAATKPPSLAIRGGVTLSHYHSDGQREVFFRSGFDGVRDKYLAPLDLRGRRVVYFYPHAYSRATGLYRFSQIGYIPGLDRLNNWVQQQGGQLNLYLPCPQDAIDLPSRGMPYEDEVHFYANLFACLPDCPVFIDAINWLPERSPAAAEVIDMERAHGRVIMGEPCAFTYQPRWQGLPLFLENSDHLAERGHNVDRYPTRKIIQLHDPKPDGWDAAAWMLDFTKQCEQRGFDWLLPAEPMVNSVPQIDFKHIDPRMNT